MWWVPWVRGGGGRRGREEGGKASARLVGMRNVYCVHNLHVTRRYVYVSGAGWIIVMSIISVTE